MSDASNHFFNSVLRETAGETKEDDKFAQLYNRPYSGRAMYGRPCPAITGSWSACQHFIAQAINGQIGEVAQIACDADNNEALQRFRELEGKTNQFVRDVLDFRTDSFGYDIIMYWPEQKYVEPEGDAPEDQG